MAVKVKLGGDRQYTSGGPARRGGRRPLWQRALLFLVVVGLGCLLLGGLVFAYYYHQYQQVVDDRLNSGPLFANTAQIYAAPKQVRTGQTLTAADIAQNLRQAGYNRDTQLGTYTLNGDTITIKPGSGSFHSTDGATVDTAGGVVGTIVADNGAPLKAYELEPQVITSLSEDKNRTKRRLVTYEQIPKNLVSAVTAIEDRRFFDHGGLNFGRLAKCGVQDILTQHAVCGGSTITQQLARGFFLSPEKHIKRKLIEIIITLQLESRFSKQQIFEMYANQINLGQRGSFAINGFGEASQAYFGKDLRQLNVAESALLAGMIQRPNYFNPFRHPERALERRNLVLRSMIETETLSPAASARAQAEPLKLAPQNVDASEAPYFVDLVHDQLQSRLGDQTTGSGGTLRIYTSLDPDLQRAAADAVNAQMAQVDEAVRRDRKGVPGPMPQVALVALDPHTGQVLALVGGRNYGASQLNHASSKRPTGSIFKPFVYATAEAGAINGQQLGQSTDEEGNTSGGGTFTAVTQLSDVPTTFTFDNGRQTYNPRNFQGHYHGQVSAAVALAQSLNNATISLGQQVGFENVAALARSSGIVNARGTPSVALGAYDATPLDMAGAYTVFANGGVHLTPWMLASVRNQRGDVVADFTPEARQVMDPKAAFLTSNLLEGVMNFGYGYVVRQRGFTAPAAGKTGTSHDAWFAAYSSNLICVVWVGNDDYSNINLTGAVLAAPIWADFMKRAQRLPQYSDMVAFTPPAGVATYNIDKASNLLADESCPAAYSLAFLDGTQPQSTCSHMGDSGRSLMDRLFGRDSDTAGTDFTGGGQAPDGRPPARENDGQPHRNIFQKMFGIGGERKDREDAPAAAPPPQPR
ncbi:MAG: transglycosylase domain-containing protein [Janthinobacterium lividum]